MHIVATVTVAVLRIAGLIQLGLGLLFWIGHALSLVPVHLRVGFLVVFSLWLLALLAARVGVSPGMVGLALVWGLVVPIVGLTQARLLPGQYHVVVQIIHLLLGVGAITFGERLFERVRDTSSAATLGPARGPSAGPSSAC
jgi:hypothetical protein